MPLLSLAQQLAEISTPAPVDVDPEDGYRSPNHSDEEQTEVVDKSLATEHYLQVAPSAIRRGLGSVSDPKYDGIRTSRRALLEDGSAEEDTEDAEKDDEESLPDTNHDFGHSEEIFSSSEEEEDTPKTNLPQSPVQPAVEGVNDIQTSLANIRASDRLKGAAIARQLAIWDSLLDTRIRLQKAVAACNRLPEAPLLLELSASEQCQESISRVMEQALLLSDDLFELREHLLSSSDDIAPPPRKKRKADHEEGASTTSAYAEQVRDACEAATILEHTYHPQLVQTLTKWSSKVQAVAPSVLLPSNRGAFAAGKNRRTKSATELVDEALLDHSKLLSRTRTYRGKGPRLLAAKKQKDEDDGNEDVEIFDDTDYYQQLLRDVIDARGNAVIGTDDWRASQKERKAKKKVDTKASKGRKIRYEVHDKLQNFMVPIPCNTGWHEEQIDELFSSLLGRTHERTGSVPDTSVGSGNTQLRIF